MQSNVIAIVVLGQSLNPDGTPSQTLLSRIAVAAKAWESSDFLSPPAIILSGGDPARTGKSEAKVMEELLLQWGVPPDFLILEEKSQNTLQNAHYSLPLLKSLGVAQVVLVTSDFHMPRASYLFEAYFLFAGVTIDLLLSPAETQSTRMSLLARLQLERGFLSNNVVQTHLPRHIPDLAIPPLSDEKMDRALKMIEKMIENETNSVASSSYHA